MIENGLDNSSKIGGAIVNRISIFLICLNFAFSCSARLHKKRCCSVIYHKFTMVEIIKPILCITLSDIKGLSRPPISKIGVAIENHTRMLLPRAEVAQYMKNGVQNEIP